MIEWEDDPDALAREAEAMDQLRERWASSFARSLPPQFREATLGTFQTPDMERAEVLARAMAWLKDPAAGLFMVGPVGSGKTHLALALARERVKEFNFKAKYVPVTQYLEQLKEGYDKGSQSKCPQPRTLGEKYDLLVLDDLGTERITDWSRSIMFSIIDSAYNNKCVLLTTTNHTLKELRQPSMLDDRCVSRLVQMTDKFEVTGAGDWRMREGRARRSGGAE